MFHVPHKIVTKKEIKVLTDPRDIYELVANMAQRRVRACLEAIIPADIVDDAVEKCRETLKTSAPVTPETIGKLVKAFAELDVSQEQIEKRLQRRIDTMSPAQMVGMRRIYKSLKDGISTPEQWFDKIEKPATTAADGSSPPADLKTRMKAKRAKPAPAPEELAQPPAADSSVVEGEVVDESEYSE